MDREELCRALIRADAVRFGTFTYASGETGPIYVDLRRLVSFPRDLKAIASGLSRLVCAVEGVELVLAAATAGIPFATLVAVQTGLPMCYIRKEAKSHGTQSQIEGVFKPGQRAALLDDLITSGSSKELFLDGARRAGLEVDDVVVVLDRRRAGAADPPGARLHSLTTLSQLLEEASSTGLVPEEHLARTREWLQGSA